MDCETALEFLKTHLPASDWEYYPEELFRQFAEHAVMLRETVPWCAELDGEVFCHYVLSPRVNDEDLSFHRKLFYDALFPRLRDLPGGEARVLEANRWCHEHASYQAQDERTASPLTVYRCGSGRCGEESAFLVSVLRSVGIPARQVYAPRWSHCDDNHAWVEVLCDGQWRFLGACEPEPVLDRGWFNAAASRAMLVHSRIFGEGHGDVHGAFLGRKGAVGWYNQTVRYAQTRLYTFRALRDGRPAAGAVFRLQVLNGAGFDTIAVLTANADGEAQARLGLGDLHVLASLDGLLAEGDCADGSVTLHLAPPADRPAPWTEFDFHAPVGREAPPAGLDDARRSARAEVLRRGNALRNARIAGFFRPVKPEWDDLLREARGNFEEILAFLQGENALEREKFLRTLTDKDLRDASREVLETCFSRRPPRLEGVPEEIYWRYTACPRIALERPGAWLEHSHPAAALRAQGVPARLRPLDGVLEVWKDGAFRALQPEETGTIRLLWTDAPLYRQNWSLSRRTPEGWQVLDLRGESQERLELPVGYYRLITSTRLPNGNQFAGKQDFPLGPGEELSLTPRLRPCALADLLYRRELPSLPARDLEGREIADLLRTDGRPKLILWLEEGDEPTEHVLNELRQFAPDALRFDIIFLLRGRESLNQPTLAGTLARCPQIRVLLDDWAYDLERVARLLALDPDAPPLAVVCGGDGYALYASCGYRAGAVELLKRVAEYTA